MHFDKIIRRLFGLLKDCQDDVRHVDVALRWVGLAHKYVQEAYHNPCNRIGMRWIMLNEAEIAVHETQLELAEMKRNA